MYFLLKIPLYHYRTEIDIVSPGICLVRKIYIACYMFYIIPGFHLYHHQFLYLRQKKRKKKKDMRKPQITNVKSLFSSRK